MPRITIIGCSGSGKSTLARTVHQRLGIPWLELDSLQHQPDWTPLDPERFRGAVTAFMDRHRDWVIDGNYPVVSDLIHPRCSDLVWLDVPLPRVLWQLGGRSLSRLIRRTELWNGNRERLRDHLSLEPGRSVLVWAMRTHQVYPARFQSLAEDPLRTHLRLHRIRDRNDRQRLLDSLADTT
ncbi:MAG: adenylate kinase [Planctomycetota bacterium]|nr:adenylate kinase [Planctomycetota bacterium]